MGFISLDEPNEIYISSGYYYRRGSSFNITFLLESSRVRQQYLKLTIPSEEPIVRHSESFKSAHVAFLLIQAKPGRRSASFRTAASLASFNSKKEHVIG